jgi:cytosine/adenosine deaminase-related metal-dependent hydrolase
MPVTAIRAAWVLPIAAAPIGDGGVLIDGGRIREAGPWQAIAQAVAARRAAGEPVALVDAGASAVLPSLVNAHTHLELSWMHRRVPPAGSMPVWAIRLIMLRRLHGDDGAAIDGAVAAMRAAGVGLVGDIGNTVASWASLVRHRMAGVLFHEVIGFRPADAERLVAEAAAALPSPDGHAGLKATLAPHAPYSVSPELLARVRAWVDAHANGLTSMHVGESPEELWFLADGGGPWRSLLESVGAWTPHWTAPGCGPVEYLDRTGALSSSFVAVHGVQLDDPALECLAARGAALVTCPRSNVHVGAGTPPIARFVASGVTLAVGTDSLASNDDLSVFAELAALRAAAPEVPARRLLEAATRGGARALGFGAIHGSIEAGKEASLIAVTLPAGVADVEEHLVSGIRPSDVTWVYRG